MTTLTSKSQTPAPSVSVQGTGPLEDSVHLPHSRPDRAGRESPLQRAVIPAGLAGKLEASDVGLPGLMESWSHLMSQVLDTTCEGFRGSAAEDIVAVQWSGLPQRAEGQSGELEICKPASPSLRAVSQWSFAVRHHHHLLCIHRTLIHHRVPQSLLSHLFLGQHYLRIQHNLNAQIKHRRGARPESQSISLSCLRGCTSA